MELLGSIERKRVSDPTCACGCGLPLTGRQKKWATPECLKIGARRYRLKAIYGITPEQYEELLEHQQWVCGLCKKPFKEGQTPHIDHEHGGPVRGIIHAYCNVRLVHKLKSWETAELVMLYLKFPPAVELLGDAKAPGRAKKKRQPRKRPRSG